MMLKQKRFKITIISFLVVTLLVVSMYTIYQKIKADIIQNTAVYVISGEEHDDISLHKGMIMVMPDKEALIGGDVVFHKELLHVEYMSLSYYYMEQGNKNVLQDNIISINNSEMGENFTTDDTGSISGKEMFGDNLTVIIDNLYFSAEGMFTNRERFEYTTKVNVKKVY